MLLDAPPEIRALASRGKLHVCHSRRQDSERSKLDDVQEIVFM